MVLNWIKRCFGLVVLIQGMLLSPAYALEVEGLYQAKVPVMGQTREERLEVYPSALAQVVVKLTGNQAVPEMPQLSGFVAQAVSLVQQFQYEELLTTNPALIEAGYKRQLVVKFDGDAISRALIDAEVPLWGRTRSEVLLWLAVEDREARYLLAANTLAELESHLIEQSARRGLPLILPLMDLEDQARLGFADVWGDFRQNILTASQRYGVDAVLVGRLIRTSGGLWQARWSLHQTAAGGAAESEYWSGDVNDQLEALTLGVDGAADYVSQRYAQLFSATPADSILLTVTDIEDLAGYARAMKYLESLDIVTNVEVDKVFADQVLFRLAIRGDASGLKRAVSLGNTLANTLFQSPDAVELSGNDVAGGQAFIYQLLP